MDTHADASALARPAALAPARPTSLNINGKPHTLSLGPRVTLSDALREVSGLTGTEKDCDHGQRDACTVLVNGRRISSRLTLTVVHKGEAIITVERLAHAHEGVVDRAAPRPVQAVFLEHDISQCGYCTPGQVYSAVAALEKADRGIPSVVTSSAAFNNDDAVALTKDGIRERVSSNLCRYGAYPSIVAAIHVVTAKSDNVA